jgi:hypothetical protein
MSDWSGADVEGFSRIFGLQNVIWHRINEE